MIIQRLEGLAKVHGRKSLYPYIVGNIRSIITSSYTADQKIQEIKEALVSFDAVKNDESLPWDQVDIKKASTAMEDQKEINQLNFTTEGLMSKENVSGDNAYKFIKLTQGQVAVVDDDVFDELNKFKWYAKWNEHTKSFYAARAVRMPDGRLKTERMHRRILSAPDGMCVDHKSGDTLNNTRANLRVVTIRENNQNAHGKKSSIFPGVCWHASRNKWQAKIEIDGKNQHLGLYHSELEAFKTYLEACILNGFSINFLIEKFNIAPTETVNKIAHLNCIMDLSKIEPLVDREMAEEALRQIDKAKGDAHV